MFSHVTLGTNDMPRAREFYDAVLGTLGLNKVGSSTFQVDWSGG
jgi:catechol 2,3-dioxygenase-like lactoylglutathione lyase family enzyme